MKALYPTIISISLCTLLNAQNISDLQGNWALAEFETPTFLTETYYNFDTQQVRSSVGPFDYAGRLGGAEQLVDVYFRSDYTAAIEDFSIDASGNYTAGDGGRIVNVRNNRVTLRDNGDSLDGATIGYTNINGDVLLVGTVDPDNLQVTMALKQPSSLSLTDLAGGWGLATMLIPSNLIKVYDNNQQLVDLYFPAESEAPEANFVDIDITGNTFSGAFEGSIAINGVNPTLSSDGEQFPFRINEAKDVMVSAVKYVDDMELIVMVKLPSSAPLISEFEGTWRVVSYSVPTALRETYYIQSTGNTRTSTNSLDSAQLGEILSDTSFSSEFRLEQGMLKIDSAGNASGLATGTLSLGGSTGLTFTDSEGTTPVYMNASKNVIINVNEDPSGNEITYNLLVRLTGSIPQTFQEEVDLTLLNIDGEDAVTWNGGNNLELQTAAKLGDWNEPLGTEGTSLVPFDPEATTQFFRVIPREEIIVE